MKKANMFIKPIMLVLKCIILIAGGAVISYGIWQIGQISGEYKEAELEYEMLADQYTRDIGGIMENVPVSGNETPLKKWKWIDFNALREINPDIVGWIFISDSKVNYPILKSRDNSEYLETTFEGKENSSGAIFMDCRNKDDFSNDNTIIYGHNMKDGSMFRILNDYAEEEFYKEGRQIWIATPDWQKSYHIISAHITSAEGHCYTLRFANLIDYETYLKEEAAFSAYETKPYDISKKTITLSTCRGSSGKRFVLVLQED